MGRVIRRSAAAAVAGLCLLSLLACVGAAWLWWRTGRAGGRVTYRTADAGYTVRLADGRLAVLRPPPHGPGADEALTSAWLARHTNDELYWGMYRTP